jgi:hypothetical protein
MALLRPYTCCRDVWRYIPILLILLILSKKTSKRMALHGAVREPGLRESWRCNDQSPSAHHPSVCSVDDRLTG